MDRRTEGDDIRIRTAGEDVVSMRSRPAEPSLPGARIYQQTQAYDDSFVLQGDVHNSYNLQVASREIWQGLSEYQQELAQRVKCELLIDSLRFPYMSARLLNVESPLSKTCQWLFCHENFIQWIDDQAASQHHGFFWIKGKPGSGKSTVMKYLHDHTTKYLWSNQITISYFFNARATGELEKSSLGLYRSLVHQLLRQIPPCKDAFLRKFQDKEYNGIVETWTTTELKAFLFDMVTSTGHPTVNIFIDALDEGDEEDVRQMIEYLERLAGTAFSSSIELRICLSSRHYPHISIRNGITMVLEEQNGHESDIRVYVQDNVYPELLPLQQQMCKKSAGIFLWIVLVVRTLNAEIDKGGDVQEIEKLLDNLPADLNSIFQGIVSKISNDMRDCISILRWVLFSRRTLSLQELYVAVQYSSISETSNLDVLPDESRLRRWLLYQSRGLVELEYNDRIDYTHHRSPAPVVRFIHETVRTFLLGPMGIVSLDSDVRVATRGMSEEMMKSACLAYIERKTAEHDRADPCSIAGVQISKYGGRAALLNKLPFMKYASDYLLVHAEGASYFMSQKPFLKAFKNSRELVAWHCMKKTLWGSESLDIRWTPYSFQTLALPLLHTLVALKLPRLVQCLVELGADINAVTKTGGSALHLACSRRNMEIIRILLEQGANIDVEDSNGRTPITSITDSTTTEKTHVNILLQLLQHGASVPPPTLVQAMAIADKWNSLPLLQLLLERCGDPNATDENGNTLLYLAGRHRQTVDLLLKRGAKLDAPCGRYISVLQAAVLCGEEKKVEVFLRVGADVNVQDRVHGNLLHAAVLVGNGKIVKLLLEAGADVNQKGGRYGSALKVAVHHFDYPIEKLLLAHGATPIDI